MTTFILKSLPVSQSFLGKVLLEVELPSTEDMAF